MIDLRSAAFGIFFAGVLSASQIGCVHAPSPLWPNRAGSIGTPSRGVLTNGAPLPQETASLVRLRKNERRFAVPRFIAAIERAADRVQAERPGSKLVIGDLSAPHGGIVAPQHVSHRSGRDADLLLYLKTIEGASIESPGFIAVGEDGLAYDKEHDRYYRFDVERQWLLVKALVTDPEARIQWLFINDNLRAMILEWAIAKGEDPALILRVMDMLGQPRPAGPHDDHMHVRTACTDEEVASGCEWTGPRWKWLDSPSEIARGGGASNEELARALLSPMEP